MDLQALKRLKQLALAELKKQVGDDSSDSSDEEKPEKKKRDPLEEKMPSTLHLLYAASKLRIYKLADKIAANEVTGDIVLRDEEQIDIPTADKWEFELGDWVRIKYSLPHFKSIQSRTLGWNARLRTIYGCQGIVSARWSPYENGVTIYMPARLSTSSIYAGLLEKIPEDELEMDESFTTRWKVGDHVTTIMDEKVVQLMQRRLDTIPQRYLGRKGRIVAVTRVAIVVTFNNRTTYDINSYLLMRCPDQTPLEIPERTHDKFKVGDKVRVISNIKQLVKNQKGNGNWNEDMTRFAGKVVTIIHICKDKKVRVQYKLGRHWIINPESLYSTSEPVKETAQGDCEFSAGEIVKIRMTNNMRAMLQKKNVPMIFLDYLRNSAKVKLIDDDLDYLIKYNCDQNVAVYAPTIRQATIEEREHHLQIKDGVKQIKNGSEVFLDVGPPSYVQDVLRDSNAPEDIVHAMTHSSTIIGFADDNRAVIRYDCGKRYKVKKKFLTVPEKFNMQGHTDGMSFETAKEIQEAIANCVQMLREDDDSKEGMDNPVRILAMSFDSTPTVDLRVYSMNATVEQISEKLLTVCEWNVQMTVVEEAVIHVSGLKSFDREIKIALFFNQEPYKVNRTIESPQTVATDKPKVKTFKAADDVVHEETQIISEPATAKSSAGPIDHEPHGPRVEHTWPQSVHDFNYLPLPRTGTEVPIYLPYFVANNQAPRRATAVDCEPRQDRQTENSGTTNIYKIGHVANLNTFNN